MKIYRPLGLWLAAGVLLAAGCSSETGPSDAIDAGASGDGTIDPANPAFSLRLEGGDPAHPVLVELLGENLIIDDAEETVSLDVSVANRGEAALFGPALVFVGRFDPPTVSPANPDVYEVPNLFPNPPPFPWGFVYDELLGEDGVLEPGEISGAKTWTFHDPGLVPFSFGARAEFGETPPREPYLGGMIWHDANRNRRRDPGEGSGPGALEIVGPDGAVSTVFGTQNGRWFTTVELPGLYRVTYFDPTDGPFEWVATTQNPLEVVLVPGPNGEPVSYGAADFGVAPDLLGSVSPVLLTDRRPEEIEQDRYELVDAVLDGDLFKMRVRYGGGCRPEHPLVLWASGDFQESDPVQTWMLLAHDDLDDPCEALIERSVVFDLDPIRQAHIDAYGRPGVVVLHFRYFGETIRFEFGP